MAELAELDKNESAFLEYVKGMRNSVGKRFIVHHIEHFGFNAFERFWEKLKEARWRDPPELELDADEQRSLARAIHVSSRREALYFAAGTGLAFLGFNALKSGAVDLMDGSKRFGPLSADEAMGVVLKLGGGGIASLVGIGLMFRTTEPSDHTVSTIAQGEDGEKNVQQLVRALDKLFNPIELSLDETRPGRY